MSVPAAAVAPEVAADALHFLPLGGSGEIGMNLNLYACQGQWLMVDLGITFAGDTLPGVDLIMPDPGFIEARRENLLAIVLTHAHEDHLGAVAFLWPRLRCPVYATPFAAAILREKLREAGLLKEVPLIEVPLSGALTLGPFALTFISLTHSIPEPNALLIETPYGRVMHTGDWKIDPDPLVGAPLDEAALRRAGEAGVLALVGDSTNATVEGESGSEGAVRETLAALIAERENGLAVALFASNVARLESVALAARDAGREPVLVGRSLQRYVRAARACGYLDGLRFLTEDEGAPLHRSQVLYLCTGCQGEPRAAMARIAADSHPRASLAEGDTVIFSSKIIPGTSGPSPICTTGSSGAASRSSRRRTRTSTCPAIPAGRSCAGCINGSGRRSRCRCTARRATCGRTARSPARSRCRNRCWWRTATCCASRRARPRSWAVRRPGGSPSTGSRSSRPITSRSAHGAS